MVLLIELILLQNAAYRPLAKSFHISVVTASYTTTVPILLAGVSPIFWSPISNVYGRRPIFIFVTALGVAAHCAAAAANTPLQEWVLELQWLPTSISCTSVEGW